MFQLADETDWHDGYIRNCPSLDRPDPSLLKLWFGYLQMPLGIDPEEFELCIPLDNKALYEGCVFVMWKWRWENAGDCHGNHPNTKA